MYTINYASLLSGLTKMSNTGRLLVFLTFFPMVAYAAANDSCADKCFNIDLKKLWYIWVFLVFVCVLLGCGILTICTKVCHRSYKQPVSAFSAQPVEVMVVAMDNENTISRISTISSSVVSSHPFPVAMSNSSPPPYNLYVIENPPRYDEALSMPTHRFHQPPGSNIDTENAAERQQVCFSLEEVNLNVLEHLQQGYSQETQDNVVIEDEEEEEEPPEYNSLAEEEVEVSNRVHNLMVDSRTS